LYNALFFHTNVYAAEFQCSMTIPPLHEITATSATPLVQPQPQSPPTTNDGQHSATTSVAGADTGASGLSDWIKGAIAGAGVLVVLTIVACVLITRKKKVEFVNADVSSLHSTEQDAIESRGASDQYHGMIEQELESMPANIPVDTNQCYGTTTDPNQLSATMEGEHQQQDMKLSRNEAYTATNIPVETNQCYGTTTTSVDPDQLRERQQQDIEIYQNEAYTTTNVPVETNQCYSTTTPSAYPRHMRSACTARSTADPRHLHATTDIGLTQNQAYATSAVTPSSR
jgi:hypothetical protein